MSRTLTWYVIREVLVPFIMGLFIFTFVVMMFQILQLVDLVVSYGVEVADVLRLLLYLILPLTVFTMPISFLLAVLLAFNRLSGDSEIIAMKASGIGLHKHLWPVLLLGLIVTAFAAFITLQAAPAGLYNLELLKLKLARSKVLIALEERVFKTDLEDLVLYVNRINPKDERMEQVFVSDTRDERAPTIVVAEYGRLIPRPGTDLLTIRLESGSIHRSSENQDEYEIVRFDVYDTNFKVDLPLGGEDFEKEYLHMGQLELAREIKRRLEVVQNPDPNSDEDRRAWLAYKYRRALTEFHRRFAFPFACLVFAVAGIPLGIAPVRSGRSRGFTVGLLVLCVYYVLFRVGENVGWRGWLHPAVMLWVPNVMFLMLGVYLLWARTTEREIKLLTWIGTIGEKIVELMTTKIYSSKRSDRKDDSQ
ncbi:MAG: LPS export ABC transporter permease LptF [Candidatus Alcyoniella australis]|nr:LPS export ABC transporter permease LptF [Candidatus Alcyoniella australis]